MARFFTLCSSSSGNSTYIGTHSHGVLIDAGTNNKQLLLSLSAAGISPESVKAVFVTHEHTDHTGALRVFASNRNIPVYATGGTLAGLLDCGVLNGKFPYNKLLGESVEIAEDIQVTSFKTSHDSRESCGYKITLPDRKIAVATDTGYVSDEMLDTLSDCDMVLIESNYDEDMLDYGPYPPYLKARIRSKTGHLSNHDCAEAVCNLFERGVRRFVLGHLSRENNTPERAFSCTNSALKRMGAVEGRDYILKVAPVGKMDKIITL